MYCWLKAIETIEMANLSPKVMQSVIRRPNPQVKLLRGSKTAATARKHRRRQSGGLKGHCRVCDDPGFRVSKSHTTFALSPKPLTCPLHSESKNVLLEEKGRPKNDLSVA